MLLHRVLTALVLLPLLLGAIFGLSTPGFYAAIACLVGLTAAWEWAGLMGVTAVGARLAYLAAMALACAAAWWLRALPWGVGALCAASALWWLWAFVLVRGYPGSFPNGPWTPARMAPLGLLLIPTTLAALAGLHGQPNGPWRVMFMLFIVFAADVGAYLAGVNFGKRKLAPAVSPGKSVEGALGGLLLVSLWVLAAGPFVFQLASLQPLLLLIVIGLVTAVVSIVGDLTESLFKRLRGVKDSGKLLPGHGGVLDRIDSILAAAPLFYLGLSLAKL